MNMLALIDDLVVTVKLKTALILLGSLAAFAASAAFFVVSFIKSRRSSDTKQAAAGFARDGSSSKAQAEPPPDPSGEQLTQISKAISDLATQVTAISSALERERSEQAEREAQRKLEIEQRAEKERAEAERARQQRLSIRQKAREQLSTVEESELFRVAVATRDLLARLREYSPKGELTEVFQPYVIVANECAKLAHTLAQPDGDGEIESEVQSVLTLIEELKKEHRPACFTDLLEEIGRYTSLQDKANELKQLLKLEEVRIDTGRMLDDLKEFEVVSSDGLGDRAIVSEVVANGYRLKETGTILKRPKVRVHYEV